MSVKVPPEISNGLPRFPDFQDIGIQPQAAVDWFFAQHAPHISEYTFADLFAWRLSRLVKLALLGEHLCVMAQGGMEMRSSCLPLEMAILVW